jgi:hypothetical protein
MALRTQHCGARPWQTQKSETGGGSWLAQILGTTRRLFGGVTIRRRERLLRLRESLALGDRRLLALVECEGQRLLIGVTNHSVSLLHRWHRDETLRDRAFDGVAGEPN